MQSRIREVEKLHMHSDRPVDVTRETAAALCMDHIEMNIPEGAEEGTLNKNLRVFRFHGGLLYIPQALSQKGKQEMAGDVLQRLLYSPHRNSIDRAVEVCPANLYEAFVQKKQVLLKLLSSPKTGIRLRKNPYAAKEIKEKEEKGEYTRSAEEAIKTIRWSSIGMYYDWEKKAYDPSVFLPFPPVIHSLVAEIKQGISGEKKKPVADPPAKKNGMHPIWEFEPNTAVINYYQQKDSIMAHVDRNEKDMSQPLISISLGCSAVFVIGRKEREDPNVLSFLLQDGDILILQHDSRYYLHGVPKIKRENIGWKIYKHLEFAPLIQNSRINISIRQA